MKYTSLLLTIRAVSAEFARRIYAPIVWTAALVLVVLLSILIWLVTVSGWWWIALVPATFLSLLFTILAVIIGTLLTYLRPSQTSEQRQKVKSFVDTLQTSSEVIATPRFIILFRLLKDVVRPTNKGFINEVSTNTSALHTRLKAVIQSFDQA